MSTKTYALVTSVLFALIGLIHLLRVIFQWPMVIGTLDAPIWVSVVAAVVLGLLSYAGCRVARKGRAVSSKSEGL
jgi:hypothetical protein